MVAEVLVGLQLVSQSCKLIKGALKSAEDVSEIGGMVENLFIGREQLKRSEHKFAHKWSRFVKHNVGSDRFLQLAIQDTLAEKECEKQIRLIRNAINRRFGPDCWNDILLQRDKRLEEHKAQVKKHNRKVEKRWAVVFKIANFIGGILVILLCVTGIYFLIKYTRK